MSKQSIKIKYHDGWFWIPINLEKKFDSMCGDMLNTDHTNNPDLFENFNRTFVPYCTEGGPDVAPWIFRGKVLECFVVEDGDPLHAGFQSPDVVAKDDRQWGRGTCLSWCPEAREVDDEEG